MQTEKKINEKRELTQIDKSKVMEYKKIKIGIQELKDRYIWMKWWNWWGVALLNETH